MTTKLADQNPVHQPTSPAANFDIVADKVIMRVEEVTAQKEIIELPGTGGSVQQYEISIKHYCNAICIKVDTDTLDKFYNLVHPEEVETVPQIIQAPSCG
ncbi:hypothetical protein SEMRO_1556_G282220.1 [Seminavis robusta]|uniref:Uncharacterized protein n=1 Tax=Seminavis robusta TaxID=568900 RepID=A0A9N8ET50_9STRA|nr:hypothetical protein SEMRO_1556_G282220.1 [Seminavis robusta]|eukprot:Sro1556_g282220.1 n/a (100) ;mRNA; f:20822-21121